MHIFLRKFFSPTAVLIATACGPFGLSALAQNPPANAPTPGPAVSLATQPLYPLSQVQAGLHGTAYTVYQGSKPEAIDLEILGVLRNAIGPGKDMILARLTGAKGEYDGVVAGMSGSPVYIDGKLAGAIGYRIGQFTKQPIAGITPIAQMLEVARQADDAPTPTSLELPTSNADSFSPDATPGETQSANITSATSSWPSNDDEVHPIDTPLVFDGFSSQAINLFQHRFNSYGLTPVSGLGGASPNAIDNSPVLPGSAISAIIVSGDFDMAATCTVTYVDPKQLLACGHPITRFGDVSLPMTKARVVTTVASSLQPMKIINTTETIGSFTEDRESGILGVFGRKARMLPVTLTLTGQPQKGQPRTYRFAVAEHPRLTSAALLATVYQAMQDANSSGDPSTDELRGTISIAGLPDVHIDDWFASTDQQPASLEVAMAISKRFDSLYANPRELPPIRNVSLTITESPGRQSALLDDAHVLATRVHAGDRVTVEATLHPYRAPQQIVRWTIALPDTLPPGPVRLLISDGTTLDHTLHLIPNPAAPPLGLAATIARLNRLHPNNVLYATLLAPVPQAMVQGQDLPAIPLSIANILQPSENKHNFSIDGETAIALASKHLDMAITGSQVLTLDVQP
ncbi:MAG: SpoIVB peptidase S55 [Acidobacteriaceae bacterium]